MPTVSKQKVNGVDYDIMDKEARQSVSSLSGTVNSLSSTVSGLSETVNGLNSSVSGLETNMAKCLIQRGTLASTDDINDTDFTKAGQWLLTSDVSPIPAHWPSDTYGRLIAFGNNSDNKAIRAQLVIDSKNRIFMRYIGASFFEAWSRLNMLVADASADTYNDCDTFPLDSIINVGTAIHTNILNYPSDYHTGAVIFTYHALGNVITGYSAAVQVAYFYNAKTWAYRVNISNTWKDWNYQGVVEQTYRCVAQSTGEPNTFTDLAWGIRSMMQRFNDWNEHYRCVIDVEPGTFSLASVVRYYNEGTIDVRGLFLPPFCTLRGSGKDRTFVTFDYNGTDETLMFYVSGLNVPYESVIQDMTISVKNLRYTIHSDTGITNMPDIIVDNNKLLNNNQITLRNVRLIHKGFDDGKHGTDPATGNPYTVPSCWGSGSWDNANQSFYDCEFIANQNTAWLNHNRTGLTKQSEFVFERCQFVNGNDVYFSLSNTYDSIIFISWGSDIKNPVRMIDCSVNRFIALSVRNNAGNVNAVCDYQLYVNNNLPVFEYNTNDSHLNDNYFTGDCKPECAGSVVTGYTPVSKSDVFGLAHTYSNSDPVAGIALNSASSGGKVVVQYSGLVYLDLLKSGGFAPGTNIGYNGTNWVEDNTHPIVKAVTQHVGKLIQEGA